MPDKMLVVILAGKNDIDRAKQGLVFAKTVTRMKLLSDVRVLFFGPGVELLDPQGEHYSAIRDMLSEFRNLKGEVSECISNVHKYGLDEKLEKELVVAEEAAYLITDSVKNGYQVISF